MTPSKQTKKVTHKKYLVMGSSNFQTKLLGLQKNLLNFAYILTANRDDAYDLLQDTTLKALDNQDKYVDNVNFKGWVFTIMRNIFINNYRKVVRSATIIDQTEDLYACSRLQIQRDCREDESSARHRQEPHILRPPAPTADTEGLSLRLCHRPITHAERRSRHL